MDLKISGYGEYEIKNVVFDLNGTLICDGNLSNQVEIQVRELAKNFKVFIASSDIYGNLRSIATTLGVECVKLDPGKTARQKVDLVKQLGPETTIAVGNGSNDIGMLKEAAIGIVVIGPEGASRKAIEASDIVVGSISDAIECILSPKRIIATLRD